jgi:ATP-dependent exoDNAse (exonuclease V) alpha subunit
MSAWKEECRHLLSRARTTQSRSKTEEGSRGQKGDLAKAVWGELGLKDWFRWADGSRVSDEEYKELRSRLWADYYELYQFADNASYSYASTCHRCQGSTVDVVVIDVKDILGTSRAAWKKNGDEELWDTRKLLYTAASRASKQLVFLT